MSNKPVSFVLQLLMQFWFHYFIYIWIHLKILKCKCMYVYVHMCLRVSVCACTWVQVPTESKSHGTGTAGACKSPSVDAGNLTQALRLRNSTYFCQYVRHGFICVTRCDTHVTVSCFRFVPVSYCPIFPPLTFSPQPSQASVVSFHLVSSVLPDRTELTIGITCRWDKWPNCSTYTGLLFAVQNGIHRMVGLGFAWIQATERYSSNYFEPLIKIIGFSILSQERNWWCPCLNLHLPGTG